MNEKNQQKIESLRKEIKTCKSWHGFCGTLGAFAVILIPLSILLGSKTLGLCAVSWIAGSFFAFVASAAQAKRVELEDEICALEISGRPQADLNEATRGSTETSFGYISLN